MSFENNSASIAPFFSTQPFEDRQSPLSLIEVHAKVRRLRQLDSGFVAEKLSSDRHTASTNTIIERGCETIRQIEQQIEGLFEALHLSPPPVHVEPFTTRMVSHYVSLYYQVLDNILTGAWRRWLGSLTQTKNPQERIELFFSSLKGSNSLKMSFLRTAIQCYSFTPILKRYCVDLFFSEIRALSECPPQSHNPLNCPLPIMVGTILQEHAHSEESLNSILNEIGRGILPSEIIKKSLQTIAPYLEAKINNHPDTQPILAPFDSWTLAVKLGASCDLGDFEAVESLVKYLRYRTIPVYCEKSLTEEKNDLFRILAPNAHLLFHGLGGGSIEVKLAVSAPETESVLIFLPASSLIFSHAFFLSQEIPEGYSNLLLGFIPCESLQSDHPCTCQPQTSALVPTLSQFISTPVMVPSQYLWLPQGRHLFTPTVSNTLRQELKYRFSANLTIHEDITTYGSPAGIHDRVIVPDSVTPLEAIAYSWSAKAPELVYESQIQNISSRDFEARKIGKIRAQRRFRSLAKRQVNKKNTIEAILGTCNINQEIRSLISHFLYRYTLKTLQESAGNREVLREIRPTFTEEDFLTAINCYVDSSPPFNFDQNLRLFVLGHNFPNYRMNQHEGNIFDLSALLFKAPKRFINFYAERAALDPDLLNTCKDLKFISEPSSNILSLWNTALDADIHCIYPDQKDAVNASVQKILRPLSEYLIHYGFSFDGGVLLAAKALGLVTSGSS
jgi:hypothetical protein